ncbi:MAG: TrbC/VirB2 family protein [Candidatus Dojkabacteria bacterium]
MSTVLKLKNIIFALVLVALLLVFLSSPVLAQSSPRLRDLLTLITRLIYLLFGVGGIFFLIVGIIIGVQWMISQGNAEKLQELRQKAILFVVGFFLFFLSVTIVNTFYEVFVTLECTYTNPATGAPVTEPLRPGFNVLFYECN